VGGAIGATGDYMERAAELVRAARGCAGHRLSARPLVPRAGGGKRGEETVPRRWACWPATWPPRGALALIEAGADAIKVGIGPGSICTTRMVTGAGMPQITPLPKPIAPPANTACPIIADGGIKSYSGEITKPSRQAASSVIDRFAVLPAWREPRRNHSLPGDAALRAIGGMGSLTAMSQGSGERYFQSTDDMAAPRWAPRAWCNASAPAKTAWQIRS